MGYLPWGDGCCDCYSATLCAKGTPNKDGSGSEMCPFFHWWGSLSVFITLHCCVTIFSHGNLGHHPTENQL